MFMIVRVDGDRTASVVICRPGESEAVARRIAGGRGHAFTTAETAAEAFRAVRRIQAVGVAPATGGGRVMRRTTILEATAGGPAVVLLVGDAYCVGDVAYRFARPASGKLPAWALGRPVTWIDGAWRELLHGRAVMREWDDTGVMLD